MLSEGQKKDLDNAPKYEPPSSYTVLNPQRRAILAESTSNLSELQAIEARKYGASAPSDGWSSNPQHRPVEAQLFETPSITLMNEAEDLAGMVKSDANIAKKLGEWADAGCVRMQLPKETVDFMCVDGAEIGAINKLMAGGTYDGVMLEPRPWLSAGVCTPHSLDLELEDIGKIPFVAQHLEEKRRAIRFIRGHHFSLFLWREKANHEVDQGRERASPRSGICVRI